MYHNGCYLKESFIFGVRSQLSKDVCQRCVLTLFRSLFSAIVSPNPWSGHFVEKQLRDFSSALCYEAPPTAAFSPKGIISLSSLSISYRIFLESEMLWNGLLLRVPSPIQWPGDHHVLLGRASCQSDETPGCWEGQRWWWSLVEPAGDGFSCLPSLRGVFPGKSQADGVLISAAEVFPTAVRSAENIVLIKDPPKTRPVL